jgi:WD40 repeat protein
MEGHTAKLWAVTAFVDDGGRDLLASGGDDTVVRVWDVATAVSVRTLAGHTKGVRGLATFRAVDGHTLLASVSADHTLRLWDIATGTPAADPITGHAAGIRAVAVLRVDGLPRLVTGGCDWMARLWDPSTGAQVGEFAGHTGWVLAVAIATHTCGRAVLLTGGGVGDQSVRVWDVVTQRELTRLVVGTQVQSIAVWPADGDRSPLIAIVSVAGIAVLRLALDELCTSPGCAKGRPA